MTCHLGVDDPRFADAAQPFKSHPQLAGNHPYRDFGCTICQVDLKELMNRKTEIEEKGAKILYITQSGEKIANEYIKKENIEASQICTSCQNKEFFSFRKEGPGVGEFFTLATIKKNL